MGPQLIRPRYNINWIYGTAVSVTLYYVLNIVFPHKMSLVSGVVHADSPGSMTDDSAAGVEYRKEAASTNREVKDVGPL